MAKITPKTFLKLALLAALLLVTLNVTAQAGVVATVQTELALRTGPGTEWRRIAGLVPGTNVALAGRDSSGLWVRGITQSGQVGWMAARFLNIGVAGAASLPFIDREEPVNLPVPPPGTAPVAPAAPAAPEAPAPAASAGLQGGIVTSATANVNVRSGPGTNFRRVAGLSGGAPFNIDGRSFNSGWVRGITAQGAVGWVSSAFIALDLGQVASLPVVDVNSPFALGAPGGGPAPVAAGAPAGQPIASTAPVRGFAYGGHIVALSDQTVNAMRSAGMTWVKKQVRFSPGNNPGDWAGFINEAHSKGFRVMLGVVGSPAQVLQPGYFDQYAAYVAGLAAAGVDAIEVWNEPNIDREWPTGQVNPGLYTQLLAAAYNAIKSVNANVLVISGAPAPTGFFGGCQAGGCDDAPYVQGMAAAGAANYMDCIGIHYNEGIVGPTINRGDPRSEYFTRYYSGMVNTYYNAFGGRRPLCFTELGYLTPEGFPPLPPAFAWAQNVTVAQQATWLRQVVDIARNSGRVRLMIIWNVDFRNYDSDPMAGYAIIRPDGSCPACNALGR